jgi:autotransporter-associated beta strand protein
MRDAPFKFQNQVGSTGSYVSIAFDPLEEDAMDRTIQASYAGRKRSTKMLRRALAVLLATTALGGTSAHGVDATWVGGNTGDPNEWTDGANWTGGNVPDGTATLSTSAVTGIDSNGVISVGKIQFTATPNAPAYTINAFDLMLVNGAGVFNNSTNTQTFNTTSTTLFQNSSTASGGSTPVTYFNTGAMSFLDSSSAGSAIITNNSVLQFNTTSSAGSAQVTNKATMDFFDGSTAASASITNAATAALTFNNTSNAGNATITLQAPISPDASQSSLQFNGASNAATATISTEVGSFANIAFNNTSNGGNAHIDLVDAKLVFNNSSNAGSAIVTMSNVLHPGSITFNDTTSAGSANITNVAITLLGSSVQFLGASTAANATITNNPNPGGVNEGGVLNFGTLSNVDPATADTANAGNATITNNQYGSTSFFSRTSAMNAFITNNSGGASNFQDQSTAANATIVNNAGGNVFFADQATAGSAHIFNQAGGTVDFGFSGIYPTIVDTATAGNSTIMNAGTINFNSETKGGNATITTTNGGSVFFFDHSTGENARFITNAGGTFDASAITSTGLSAGSIEGGGNYFLGSKTLTVGSNDSSTAVSGVISDGGTAGGTGGSLVKTGVGTMTLTGTNTYSGGTTISDGTLQLGNGGATGSIIGDVLDNSIFAINRSDTFTFAGTISGTGAFQQIGAGTTIFTNSNSYSGGTTITAGKLQLGNGGAAGSIVGNVANNGILAVNRSDSYTFSGVISGSGAFQQIGSGATVLTADNTYTGGTTITAGILQLGNGGTSGSVTGNIVDNAVLAINRSNTVSLGGISGSGGLQQNGTGTTVLTGTNTYSGPTTVTAGNLQVNGSVISNVNVQSGAMLSGTGSVSGAVTLQSGGTLSPGQGGPGTLTLGALTLNTGSTSIFELGSPGVVGGSSNDLVNVTGNLKLGGTLSVNAPSAGYYRLFNYGTLTPSNFDAVTGSSNGAATVLTNVPNQVNLSIVGAGQQIQFWDGADQVGNGVVNGGTGTWNATNTNWTGAPGQATVNDQWHSSVGVFAGTAGTVTVSGTQAFDTLQFSTTGYVLTGGQLRLADASGNGTINTDNGVTATIGSVIAEGGGAHSLTKVGGGTLILTGANTYSGGTVISGGTLQLGNGGATGSITGNILDNGILAINRSDILGTLTLAGVISGSGALQQIGPGTTKLTAANTYTGTTTVTAGTLQAGSNAALSPNSAFVVGTTTTTATLNLNGFSNTIASLSGNASGIVTNSAINTTSILTVGGDNNWTMFAGDIKDGLRSVGVPTRGVGLTKVGSGTLLLSGNNNYTRATTIQAGSLRAGSTTALSTSSAFTVGTGAAIATLDPNGYSNGIGPLSGNANGIVTNTSTTAAATLTTNAADVLGAVSTTFAGTVTDTSAAGALDSTAAGKLSLVKNGGGTLTLSGPVSYKGDTTVNAGTLFVMNAFTNATGSKLTVNAATYSIDQLLTNAGAIVVNSGGTLNATLGGVTNTATGSITVALGGTVNDDLNNAGVVTNSGSYVANVATNTGAGNITNTTTGNWTGNVLSNAAIISNSGLWNGNATNGAGGTLTNSGTWTGTVANAGIFNNNAGGTVSGLLTNTAGTTTNNGALNGGATVSGGAFTGSGSVTNLTVSGGTFAPGTGTPGSSMTVTGNLVLQSAATYLVQVSPASASFAAVGGTANIAGTAAAVYVAGNYVAKTYTIMTAAGGVNGTFNTLVNTNLSPNVSASLSYDANDVFLNLKLNFVPPPGGLNINQQNVANAVVGFFNSNGGIPLVFSGLTPAGLTQASGELGTGVIQSSIKANDMFLNLLLDPAVAGRAGGFASGPAASQFAADDEEALAYAAKRKASSAERDAYAMATKAPYLAPQPVNRWSVWGAAYGGSAVTDGNAIVGSHDTTARAYGVVGGADYKVTPDALIGFALAGGGTSFSIANALGSGNSDLFQAGVFGRQNIGAAYLSAALAYGWQDVTTNRTVTIAGTDALRANFKAETFSARFEGGYRFATPFAGITPYVAAQAISFNLPAYAEQVLAGTGTFALNYGAQTTTATRTELGLRSDKSFAVQDGVFTLRGRAAWAHDYNNDRAVTAVFQTLPGASFVVNGARANPDGALVSAGAEMKWLNGFSLAATFEGEFSGNVTSYAGKGVAKYTW